MDKKDLRFIESQLNKVYELLKEYPERLINGSGLDRAIYELEKINIAYEIPFKD